MTVFFIKNGRPVAYTNEQVAGRSARVSWHRNGSSYANFHDVSVSRAQKWKKSDSYIYGELDYAVSVDESDFYAGDDKPQPFIASKEDRARSGEIQKILGREEDFSALAASIKKEIENGKDFGSLSCELQVICEASQKEANAILDLFTQ